MINRIGDQYFIENAKGKHIDIKDSTTAERCAYYNKLSKSEVAWLLEKLGGFDPNK